MKKIREIFALEKALLKLDKLCTSIDFVQVRIASPERIKSWSIRRLGHQIFTGNINTNLFIDFQLQMEDPDEYGLGLFYENGLFCQKIFGPIKDNTCACLSCSGNFVKKICVDCKVELTESRVRRYRMVCVLLASW